MFSLETIKQMNAEEARKRSEIHRPVINVANLIDAVDRAIRKATIAGQFKITVNPLAGLREPISDKQRAAVWAELRDRGFKVRTGKRFLISW